MLSPELTGQCTPNFVLQNALSIIVNQWSKQLVVHLVLILQTDL